MGLQKNDDVCMRKPPLLKLNGIEVASHVTESTILDLLDKGVKLCMEDADAPSPHYMRERVTWSGRVLSSEYLWAWRAGKQLA